MSDFAFVTQAFEEEEEVPEDRQQAWQDWLQQYKALLKAEGQSNEQRIQTQNSANPCYIPRNHLLQNCIELALELSDFSEVSSIMHGILHFRTDGGFKQGLFR